MKELMVVYEWNVSIESMVMGLTPQVRRTGSF